MERQIQRYLLGGGGNNQTACNKDLAKITDVVRRVKIPGMFLREGHKKDFLMDCLEFRKE